MVKITDKTKCTSHMFVKLGSIPPGQAFYARALPADATVHPCSMPIMLFVKVGLFTVAAFDEDHATYYQETKDFKYHFYEYEPVNIEIVVTEASK